MKAALLFIVILSSCASTKYIQYKFGGESVRATLGQGLSVETAMDAIDAVKKHSNQELYIYSVYRHEKYIEVLTLNKQPEPKAVSLTGESFRFELVLNGLVKKRGHAPKNIDTFQIFIRF